MDLEYLLITLLGYIFFPYILVKLCYILTNKATNKDIISILMFVIIPIYVYISAFITSSTGVFFSFIQNCSKYLILFYIITMFLVRIAIVKVIANMMKILYVVAII